MRNVVSIAVLCFLSVLKSSYGGTTTAFHRETSLDELKSIDSLVASGLPLFSHGFFVDTAQGPILVKNGDDAGKKPKLNPGYYSTLPRLIPQGYEGLSISHFNLGSSFPAQVPTKIQQQATLNEFFNQPQSVQYEQYSGRNYAPVTTSAPVENYNVYEQQHQQQQQQPQQYEQQQPQQSQNYQTYFQHSHQVQHQRQEPAIQQRQTQRLLPQTQPQPQYHPQQQTQVGQETFQIDNFLTPGDDTPTSYQNMEFGHERFVSHKFIRNPTVEQASAFDETLPEGLRNRFYRNDQLATALAQESLPVQGEEVVGEWDTTKIQKSKIHELLRGAGLI